MLAVLMLIFCSCAFAANQTFKCADCHDSPKDVLAEKHAKIDSFDKCFSCHAPDSKAGSLGEKIHPKHFASMEITAETCESCHPQDSEGNYVISNKNEVTFGPDEMSDLAEKYATWNQSEYLSNAHKDSDVYCLGCHETFGPDDVDDMAKKCKSCHGGFEQIAPKTMDLPRNPHKSHFGNISCVKCHNAHEKFNDFCDKCHKTNMTWTRKAK